MNGSPVALFNDGPGGGAAGITVSAGASSGSLGSLIFSNSNGVSFGLSGSTITGSVETNYQAPGAYLTTAMQSNRGSDFVQANATFAGTNASGTIASGGLSVSVGNYITTARASNDAIGLNTAKTNVAWTVDSRGISLDAGGYAGTGFTSTSTAGANIVGTHNTAGLSIGVPAYLTTADLSQNSSKYAGINGAITGGSITVNTSGVSVNIASQTNQSEGMYAVGNTTGQSSSSTFDARTMSIQGTGAVSVGYSNGSLIISGGTVAAGSVSFSAGTSSAALGSLVFSNSNNVSFGLNGSTITGSVIAATHSILQPFGNANSGEKAAPTGSTIYLGYFQVAAHHTMTELDNFFSLISNVTSGANNTTYSGTISFGAAIYSASNATKLNLLTSNSTSISFSYTSTGNTSLSGDRFASMPFNQLLTPGDYWYAMSMASDARRSAAGGSSSTTVGLSVPVALTGVFQGVGPQSWQAATNSTVNVFAMVGNIGASNAFPATVGAAGVTIPSINNLSLAVPVMRAI